MTPTRSRVTVLNMFKSLKNISDDTCISFLTEEYQETIAPASVHSLLPPSFTRATFIGFLAQLRLIVEGFDVKPLDIIEDEKQNKVVVIATNEFNFREEVKDHDEDWAYKGEYVFIFTLDEAGEKIKHMFEFVDPIAIGRLTKLMAKANENVAKKNGN